MLASAVSTTVGLMARTQGGKAFALGTQYVNEFLGPAMRSGTMIEDGIELVRNGRSFITAGTWIARLGVVAGGLVGGYAIGASGMCLGDRTAYGP